ncbi:DUF971 domain-containing protein [soil metagenome]
MNPVSLRREGEGLRIDWSDGASTFATWRVIRNACPCATCNDERSKPSNPFRILSEREVAAGAPEPVAMKPVGHYAYQITWNDGHGAGIYTLESLRTLGTS